MAENNNFMTILLTLLNEDKFMKDDTSQTCSGIDQVDVKYCLSLIKKILDPKGNQGQSKSFNPPSEGMPAPLSSTINKLCCQITCEALHTNDARRTMKLLFDELSSFSWDAKAVLTLSALSVYYAENWHHAETEKSNYKLALAAVLRGSRADKSAFAALKHLIGVILEFTDCTVEFANYCKSFGESTSIDIRARFYQIIVGVLGCSVPFCGMISTSNEFPELNLLPFSDRIMEIYESFKEQVEKFKQKNAEQLQYKKIREIYGSAYDILEFMAVLFCTEKDSPTVYHCSKKTAVKLEVFQKKNVMLLISGLDLSNDDFKLLTSIYNESTFKSNYEIMWVPIADVEDAAIREQFQNERSRMPWYSCNSIVSKASAKFIKKRWQFKQQTKVVVLNQEGKVVNMDAMTMIRLWGSEALPFTQERGCELWEGHRNNWLKLVVDNTVVQSVEQSFANGELIFLYGSAEDSKTVEEIENHLSKIKFPVPVKVFNINTKRKQFLFRLENCISWMMQANKEMPNSLMPGLPELYSSYKKQSGFAIVARGSSVIVNTSGTDLLKVLSKREEWINNVTNTQDFETRFVACHNKVAPPSQCLEFSIPNMVGDMPEYRKCPEAGCTLNMETVTTFKCCHGKH